MKKALQKMSLAQMIPVSADSAAQPAYLQGVLRFL
jgi:hypothetical protein